MKKIAIITLNGYYNYGNRLQNYALQEILKSLNCYVETIRIENKKINENIFNKLKNKSIKQIINMFYIKLIISIYKKTIDNRTIIFKNFTKNYINETNFTISDDNIPINLSDKYDYFITGSDQVWNYDYINGSSIYFLIFAEKHKRIAYAPSFGVSEIKSDYKDKYKTWISEMYRLSVREDEGARIIKELTGIDTPVLLDPTMLISREKWISISQKAKNKPNGKYLLTYFLGGINLYYKNQIKKFAKRNNLKILNLGNIKEKETYETGPSEFIDYIKDCSIMFTDSFHGTVFSILFEKPFVVFNRLGELSMYSRINTLLNKFNLNSRRIENISLYNNNIFYINYSYVYQILEYEREKALNYLKNALNIEDDK